MVAEASTYIGKYALYQLDTHFSVWVEIRDAREVFGRKDYKVQPVEGNGHRWVSANALSSFLTSEEFQQ